MRLRAVHAPDIMRARNTLTQKLIGGKGTVTVEQCVEGIATGQRAGLSYLGADADNWICVERIDSGFHIEAMTAGVAYHGPEICCERVWFRTRYDFAGATTLSFSTDGTRFLPWAVSASSATVLEGCQNRSVHIQPHWSRWSSGLRMVPRDTTDPRPA